MKRHFVAAIFLAIGLAVPALAAEKSSAVGGAGKVAGASTSKQSKKTAAKKKPSAGKPMKVAQAKKSGSGAKDRFKTSPRMRGYGS
jgi:hypothetical protein